MTDVFNSDPVVPDVDPLAELVGEGKKFKTPEDLAKGKLEADQFIERLKSEMAELRQQLEGQTKLDELKEELKQLKEQRQPPARDNTSPALSEANIEALVTKAITTREATRTAVQNVTEAQSAVIEKLGSAEKASEFVSNKAKELGVSTDELKTIASKSPTAFLKMLDITSEISGETFVRGTVNTAATPSGQGPKEGTKAFFDKLRKENPKEYWRPATQQKMFEAAKNGTYA